MQPEVGSKGFIGAYWASVLDFRAVGLQLQVLQLIPPRRTFSHKRWPCIRRVLKVAPYLNTKRLSNSNTVGRCRWTTPTKPLQGTRGPSELERKPCVEPALQKERQSTRYRPDTITTNRMKRHSQGSPHRAQALGSL